MSLKRSPAPRRKSPMKRGASLAQKAIARRMYQLAHDPRILFPFEGTAKAKGGSAFEVIEIRLKQPKRKSLRKVGARAKREKDALKAFREAVLKRAGNQCEGCGLIPAKIEAHHIVNRARAVGCPYLHDPRVNGLGVCRACHESLTKWPRIHPLWQDEWLLLSERFDAFEKWRAGPR